MFIKTRNQPHFIFMVHWKRYGVLHPSIDTMSTGQVSELLQMIPARMPDLRKALDGFS